MADEPRKGLPHLHVREPAETGPYTYPHGGGGGDTLALPKRVRAEHAEHLLGAFDRARESLEDLRERRRAVGIAENRGAYLEFESDPDLQLALRSLDRTGTSPPIELVAVRELGQSMLATVFVPDGKLEILERLITRYRDEETPKGRPKNRKLSESIAEIRHAAIRSFWTDDPELLPDVQKLAWWEVWLRVGQDRDEITATFESYAGSIGIRIRKRRILFSDRTVLLVLATREQISQSVELLDCIAELRLAKEHPEFFMDQRPSEQAEWVDDLLDRVEGPPGRTAAVCLLDTGVNNGHPLLRDALSTDDLLACDPEWGGHADRSHGTEMAGLCVWGDLTEQFAASGPVIVEHCLESVKVLPPPDSGQNDPDLYGNVTQEAMARMEVQEPHRQRVYCMAVSTPDDRDRGKPSSWSAAVDDAACGFKEEQPRLVLLAAGNVLRKNWHLYPDRNDVDQIHDPGQAWNALTVGATTEKIDYDTEVFPGWTPLARPGGLGPSSTTSVSWGKDWPNKPDLVLEGGNGIREADGTEADTDDSLLLLTTHSRPPARLLTTTGDTSAATAQAARMAARLMARYPDFWPETVRGLLVHSAEWTQEMKTATTGRSPGERTRLLLRRYGYGVPDLERASWSASNLLTLVAQDSLQPFEKRDGRVVTKDLGLHALPWPREELASLGSETVELRVTLSYFIEPNPARRGWKYRHRYASHGLRFAIKLATEEIEDFRARVSKDAQSEERPGTTPQDPGWAIGPTHRNRGSIHSDSWTGTAADLAERGYLAVFPVGGWWKERPQLQQRPVRYSLIVTVKTPETTLDIYTAVANRIGVEVPL